MRLAWLAVLALAVLAVPAVTVGAPAPVTSGHYLPHAGDSFTFHETIVVNGGYGYFGGYTETTVVNGTLNVTKVYPNGTANATYDYQDHYTNSTGANLKWTSKGNFSFSGVTELYVQGTDNQTGYTNPYVWFYQNSSLGVGSTFSLLNSKMTVEALNTSYVLETAAGTYVKTTYADGTGSYYNATPGGLNATYDWKEFLDPTTGYVVGYQYVEHDWDGVGDGYVYTDTLDVTKTSYALTPASAPPVTYSVGFQASGLKSGANWTVTFDGIPETTASNSLVFAGVRNGTYPFTTNSSGYSATPEAGYLTVNGIAPAATAVAFATPAPATPWLLYAIVALVVVVVVVLVLIVLALARRARRSPALPRHSMSGQVRYGPPPPPLAAAPPPISLTPSDQPRIQQVVVKEVVKVNCKFCGSLIDSTAEKCPFCGATRS